MNLVLIFHSLGPYHVSRLQSVSKYNPVSCIELSGVSNTYKWDSVQGQYDFTRLTLFEKQDSRNRPIRELKKRLFSALNRLGPDVLVVNGWSDNGALLALFWALKNSIPTVVMSESTVIDFKRVIWREWIKGRIVSLYSGALVGGKPHARYLQDLGMKSCLIRIGYDVVDNDYFSESARTLRNRKGSNILNSKYFLASCRFIPKKNLLRLVEAYSAYRSQVSSPWDLVLLGDGELMFQVKEIIKKFNLSKYIHLNGFCQYAELPKYYANASAFVHASTSEQWGLVVNEAMASSLPILVSNRCGCAEDLVNNGVNGFCFDPFNTEQISKSLLKISSLSDEELQVFGKRSFEIIQEFHPDIFGKNLIELAEMAQKTNPSPNFLNKLILRLMLVFPKWK